MKQQIKNKEKTKQTLNITPTYGHVPGTWSQSVALEGMRGGVCAGRLDKLLLHPLSEPHFFAIPNGVLDFRGPEMNPSTLFRNLIF